MSKLSAIDWIALRLNWIIWYLDWLVEIVFWKQLVEDEKLIWIKCLRKSNNYLRFRKWKKQIENWNYQITVISSTGN